MRRSTRLGLAGLVVVLLLCGTFTAYWLIAAGRVRHGFTDWAQGERARNIDVSWRGMRVTGFPFAFRVALDQAVVQDRAITPAPEMRIPSLSARAGLWNFAAWQFDAPQGLAARIAGVAGQSAIKLAARSATGIANVERAGGTTIRIRASDVTADAGAPVAIGLADGRITLPPHPPQSHGDPLFDLVVRLQQLRLPEALRPFGSTIEDLAFGVTVDGIVPRGPLIPAITAWRNSGGTIELDHLHLRWGALRASASGTLALDQNLQPIAAFSGALEGYDEILSALVRNGRMRAKSAGLARLVLGMLAKIGPDGKPRIATSFTIQNGEMYLGPAKLGPAPRLAWE